MTELAIDNCGGCGEPIAPSEARINLSRRVHKASSSPTHWFVLCSWTCAYNKAKELAEKNGASLPQQKGVIDITPEVGLL